MKKNKGLVTRWQNPDLLAFHQKMKNSLETGTFQEKLSPFGQIDERWDFRGYDFHQHRYLKNCRFDNIDFSYAYFDHARVRLCQFSNIIFEETSLIDFVEHGCMFDQCKFYKSSICGALGYDGSKYIHCIYEKCLFKKTDFIRAEFTQCQFHNNNLSGTQFGSSSFEDCIFTGKVKNVWFQGGYRDISEERDFGKAKPNPMTVSFEDAELLEMTFTMECDLSKVILPKKGRYYRFDHWKKRLEHIASIVSTWPESETKKKILFYVEIYLLQAVSQSWMILNLDEHVNMMGEDAAVKYIELLTSFRHDCDCPTTVPSSENVVPNTQTDEN